MGTERSDSLVVGQGRGGGSNGGDEIRFASLFTAVLRECKVPGGADQCSVC